MRVYASEYNTIRYNRRQMLKRRALLKKLGLLLWVLGCTAIIMTFNKLVPNSIRGDSPAPFAAATNTNEQNRKQDTANLPWELILVNKWNKVPKDYSVELTTLPNGEQIDSRIYAALQEMLSAANNDGIYPIVASGYRTKEQQQQLLDERAATYKVEGVSLSEAREKAGTWVAAPGTSEHQLGIAVDINADGTRSTGTDVYKWMRMNSHKFGFINRYPADKTYITGISDEPWHYRYVGKEAASALNGKNACFEEYITKLCSQDSGVL